MEKQNDSNRECMTSSLDETMNYLKERLAPDSSFDVVYRVIEMGGKRACIYFITVSVKTN